MFLSSRARKAGLVLGALYIAYILVFSRAESLLGFSIDMVIVTGLICIGVEFLYRLAAWWLARFQEIAVVGVACAAADGHGK